MEALNSREYIHTTFLKIKVDKLNEFRIAIDKLVEEFPKLPGLLDREILQTTEDPTECLICARFTSEDACKKHRDFLQNSLKNIGDMFEPGFPIYRTFSKIF